MNQQKELDKIAKEIESCKECKKDSIGVAVPGEGNPNADIVFIGEAPGKQEAKTGRPFIGRSGKLLRSLIEQVGLKDEDVYITSPVKYLPERGTPSKQQIAHGKKYLDRQLDIINPKIIVLLGKVACLAVLNEDVPIAKMHGQILKRDGKQYVVEYHPAAALRFQKIRKVFLEDFKKLVDIVRS